MACKFELAWRGMCNAVTPDDGETTFCEEHAVVKCVSCGVQAIRECEEIIDNKICGASLCAKCHGSLLFSNGDQTHTHSKGTIILI